MLLPKVADAGRVDLAGWTAQGMKATATGTVDFSGTDGRQRRMRRHARRLSAFALLSAAAPGA